MAAQFVVVIDVNVDAAKLLGLLRLARNRVRNV